MKIEPRHDKTNKMICAPSEDSDQPGHPPSLIRVSAVRLKQNWVLSYPLSAQRRLCSHSADAKADLSLRWTQKSFCWFSHELAQNAYICSTYTFHRRWVGRQTQWWPRHKAIYFSWFGPELFCLLLGPPGLVFFCSSVPVVLFDTPGISRCRSQHISVESSSLLHHSIYLWFICFTWWSIDELENLHADRTTVCFEPW